MNALRLTGKEQEFFAELCSLLRGWLYQELGPKHMAGDELRDRVALVVERFGLSPQDLDRLYDIMHRTGANAPAPVNPYDDLGGDR